MTFSEYEGIGYRAKTDGTYEMIHVDENYAMNNLVWVISMNETIDTEIQAIGPNPSWGDVIAWVYGQMAEIEWRTDCENGVQDEDEAGIDCGGTSGCGPCPPGGGGTSGRFKHVVLTGIKVYDKKEGFLAGKCDFAVIGFQYGFEDACAWERFGCLKSPADVSDCTNGDFNKKLREISNDDLENWLEWPYADGYKWRDRNFAWDYGVSYVNSCPDSYLDQQTSQLRRSNVYNPEGEKMVVAFFERDQSNRRYLYHPTCTAPGNYLIRYKSEQEPYAVFEFDYDDLISQCVYSEGNTYPDYCDWTETVYECFDSSNNLDAEIKLTVKEKW